MESLYANCWGGGAVQQQQPQQQPTAVIQAKTINLDPWGNDGIYEEKHRNQQNNIWQGLQFEIIVLVV